MAKKTRNTLSKQSSHASQTPDVLDKKHARRDARQLGLNKADLPNSIKEVIATLTEAGFEAYIVGGGVRDALLGLRPKDFDAVTDATPSQIKDIFGKRCRIIGRRFQLCHVYSGRDMIEVATFRAPPKDDSFTTEEGMLMRDNVWGDIYQDAVRRDFSINALYYQPLEGFVYDFCGGLADMSSKTLRLLGDAQKRVEEDPVRLLRALRFKAKLGFRFSTDLESQFDSQNWSLIANVSPHRLYDETQKMFTGGYLVPLLPLLFDYRAFEHLIFYPPAAATPLVQRVAINTDTRIHEGKSINPAFFYAAILWENYLFLLDKFKKNMPFAEAQHHAANKVMDKQRELTAMPKFAEQFIKDIWLLQPRLAEPRRKNIAKLFENPRFRAGFDFLHLREMMQSQNDFSHTLDNESTNHMGDWWAWFQTLSVKQQTQAIGEFDLEKVKQRFGNANNSNKGANKAAKNSKAAKQKSRLTQQEQDEKAQLRQLSLATPQPAQTAKPLWETPDPAEFVPEDLGENAAKQSGDDNSGDDNSGYDNSGYDLENFDTPRPSRRERRLANQALREQTQKTQLTSNHDENLRSPRNATQQASRLVEQAVPARRQRREPSSDVSVLERKLLEKGEILPTPQRVKAVETGETPDNMVKKPRTRKANAVEQTAVIAKTAEPTIDNLSTKIPAKRTRKKVVGSETVKEASNKITPIKADNVIEMVATIAEKPPVKRGRKPKAVAENTEILDVKNTKIPAKRTRKKPSE